MSAWHAAAGRAIYLCYRNCSIASLFASCGCCPNSSAGAPPLDRFAVLTLSDADVRHQPSMLPGQKFDESRLVKPGDWDRLAAADDDDDDLLDFEAQMESDFAALKAEVTAEKAKGEVKSKAAIDLSKPIELKASETAASQDLSQID